MEVLKVCRICLVMDVNMYDLRTQPLETYFELVIGNLLNSTELPPFACFQCAALLKKFYYFRDKCLKGQSILYGIIQSSGKITEQELQQINRPSNLTVHEIPQNNIIYHVYDEDSVLIIKKEPAIEDDIRIVKIEGGVKNEDYCSNLLLCQSTSEDEFEDSTKEECFGEPTVLSTENVESLSLQTNNKEKKTKEKKKCREVKKKDTVDPLEDTEAIFIFGISGACKRQELVNINVTDIENHGDLLLVKIPDTKTKIPRTFTIHGEFYAIVKKYQALRITNTKSNRFFQKYKNGKCMRQVIGVNKIGSVPKEIATFLKLDNPASYTGHSFRRTSATLLANSGADIITLKRHGAWRSNSVAGGYIENPLHNNIERGDKMSKSININNFVEPRPSTSRESVQPPPSSPTFTPHSSVQHNKSEIKLPKRSKFQ